MSSFKFPGSDVAPSDPLSAALVALQMSERRADRVRRERREAQEKKRQQRHPAHFKRKRRQP